MADSIFTKIIKGEIPAHKLYEDDKTLAFLDIGPVHPGHTLVVPKLEVDHIWDLPDEDYEALVKTAKKVAQRLHKVLKTDRIGAVVKGVDVPHAHIHLIPFNAGQRLKADEPSTGEPDHAALAKMAKRLAF